MRTAVWGAALRIAGAFAGGAAFAAFEVCLALQVRLSAYHVALGAPRFQAPLLAPLWTQSLPPLLGLIALLVLALLALLAPALLAQGLGVPRFQDLSFSR